MVTKSPTQPNATRALDRPKTRKQVEAWILEGVKDAEIARRVGVHRSAIFRFRQRHIEDIAPAVEQVEKQIADAAIADKVRRILDADEDYRRLGSVIEARANDTRYDEPGYKSGVMVHQPKQIGSGKSATLVDEYKVDTALIAERRALRRAVAEELGALPRPETHVNIDNRRIVVRYVEGPQ